MRSLVLLSLILFAGNLVQIHQTRNAHAVAHRISNEPDYLGVALHTWNAIDNVEKQNERNNPYDPRCDWLYRAYLLATIIGVGVALLGVRAIYLQTKASQQAATAAKDSADAFKNSERAWIVVKLGSPSHIDNRVQNALLMPSQFAFDWEYKNVGRTVALITKVGIRFHPISKLSDLPIEPDIDKQMRGYYQGMPQVYRQGLALAPDEPRKHRTFAESNPPDDRIKILAGEDIWLAYGVIEYRLPLDDKLHETRFCYRWDGGVSGFIRSPLPENYTKYT